MFEKLHRTHSKWSRIFLVVILALLAQFTNAAEDYLQPEAAFKFSAKMRDAGNVEITYVIADGYYMYRERFHFRAEGAKLGMPIIPRGKIKYDETFEKDVETFRHAITIKIPVQATSTFKLISTAQGCADKGLCYAPMDSEIQLTPGGAQGLQAAIDATKSDPTKNAEPFQSVRNQASEPVAIHSDVDSEMGRIEHALKSGRLLVILPLFMLLGLGLSFTPCVLPMVPILSFIIVGEGAKTSRARGFVLSSTYAMGMALVYTALGIAAGLIGEGLSAALQNPWILAVFAILMVLLSLSMFGVYHLQVPTVLQSKLTQLSESQKSGKLIGVFVMGAISALIIGPCVAAPLAGALVYISQTRDLVIGGSALFAMAMGMSVPLLLVGVSAGELLPRAGAWMEGVKRFFGVLMLAMALWIVMPAIPDLAQMLGWAALGLGYSAYLLSTRGTHWVSRVAGLAFAVFGMVQLVGASTGGRDVFAPLAHLSKEGVRKTEFVRIKSIAELDAAVAQSRGKTVMLDFYADWCISCIEMEKRTFTDVRIRAKLDGMVLLQADVTANNADDKALLNRFQLFGPPGIIFFDELGREIEGGRVIGFENSERFSQSLARVLPR